MDEFLTAISGARSERAGSIRLWRLFRIGFAIGLSLVAIWVAFTTIGVMVIRFNPVVNGDQWSWIELLRSWTEKGFNLTSLFAVVNEHRIAFFRGLLFADYLIDHSTNSFLYITTLLEYILTIVVFIFMYKSVTRHSADAIDLVLYVAFITTIFFSGANLYNLTFGYQAGFVFGHVGVVFAALSTALGIEAFKSGKQIRGLSFYFFAMVIAFMATFAQSNSVFIWPMILFMSYFGRVPLYATVTCGIVGAIAVTFFFSGFGLNTVMGNTDPAKTWTVLRTYYEYIEQFLGNIIVSGLKFNTWSYIMGLAGVIGAISAGVALLRNRDTWTPDQLALVAIMGFGLITAWLIACARQGWGGSVGMVADRYRISSEVFWAAAIALILSAPRRPAFKMVVRAAVGLFMIFTTINVA